MLQDMARTIESEKYIEKKLKDEVKRRGGVALKFSSGSEVGFPDRCVLLPGGRCYWVELKTTGEKPRAIQRYRHNQLKRLGFEVFVIDSTNLINQFINTVWQEDL